MHRQTGRRGRYIRWGADRVGASALGGPEPGAHGRGTDGRVGVCRGDARPVSTFDLHRVVRRRSLWYDGRLACGLLSAGHCGELKWSQSR